MRFLILITFLFSGLSLWAIDDNSPCVAGQSFRIVVLGSSTAAGTGPSSADSAWVNRYRAYVQAINPSNEVINLAQGGYTTYKIMPTGWTQPAGRPTPDTARNITKALSLNPDAIIVNMPSNDASNGFGVAEQMFNFDSLYSMANNNGVQIWICTTQPKTSLNVAGKAIQVGVRDSIFAHYGPYAIDFWTTIADTNASIQPQYNADGTHLNDAGHAILVSRVISEQILGNLFTLPPTVDVGVTDIWGFDSVSCGTEYSTLALQITSFGQPVNSGVLSTLKVDLGGNSIMYSDTAYLVGTCAQDTVYITADLSETGQYQFTAFTQTPADTLPLNDTLWASHFFLGTPEITPLGDGGCVGDALTLTVTTNGNDVPRWYDAQQNVLGGSSTYSTPSLNVPTTYYVQAYRPDVTLVNTFATPTNTTTAWDGYMFDIVAQEDLLLDSITIIANTLGNQPIELYYKLGTHIGSESTVSAWTLWTTDTFTIITADSMATLRVPSANIVAGDTLGLYVNMVNANADLRYLNSGGAAVQGNQSISVLSGTGITNGFTQSYYPRLFRGQVHYSTSTQTNGQCKSPLLPVVAFIDTQQVSITAPDTVAVGQTLIMTIAQSGNAYWSTGDTGGIVSLDSLAGMPFGDNQFWVNLESVYGCTSSDTVTVYIISALDTPTVVRETYMASSIAVYPNPSSQYCTIESSQTMQYVQVWSTGGKLALANELNTNKLTLDVSHIAPGVYLIEILLQDHTKALHKLVVER